ncbi:hypothetical protein P8452_12747 [Trifolium repens]|nr:hypothetical protein P8452_12747 [Trifolium repens]
MAVEQSVEDDGGRCGEFDGGDTLQIDDGTSAGCGGRFEDGDQGQEVLQQIPNPGTISASGLILLSGSDISRVSESLSHAQVGEKDKLTEAAKLLTIQKEVSDHFPLILKYSRDDWRPKPFRFNNFWLDNKKLQEVVESFWVHHKVEGWMSFVLKEKLKLLKSTLRS